MRVKYLFLLLAMSSMMHVWAQNTLLVYTKFPTHLNFVDEADKPIKAKSIWNQADGGLVLNFEKMENTYVVADEMVNFKLSNQSRLTKLISLDTKNKISLHKCFTSEKYCCEKLTDKQKKGTEKLLAVSVMKKSAAKNSPLLFSDNNLVQIKDLNELSVSWETKLPIIEIYLVDITELETIWQTKEFTSSVFKASDLVIQNIELKTNHKYQLNIQIQTTAPEAGKFSFEFDYTDLAFNTNEYHFATQESVSIGWRTESTINTIEILDQNAKPIWQENNYSKQNLSIAELTPETINQIEAGKEYTVKLTLPNNTIFEYQFMVLLDQTDSDELKALLDF